MACSPSSEPTSALRSPGSSRPRKRQNSTCRSAEAFTLASSSSVRFPQTRSSPHAGAPGRTPAPASRSDRPSPVISAASLLTHSVSSRSPAVRAWMSRVTSRSTVLVESIIIRNDTASETITTVTEERNRRYRMPRRQSWKHLRNGRLT